MKLIFIVFLIILIIFLIYYICYYSNLDKNISKINLDKIDNLMIVAHPDDETIWGGAHLIKDNYLVVCITCGRNRIRYHELKRVMKETNNSFLALYYPDKTFGKRNDWSKSYNKIYNDLEKIIKLKKWDTIVSHNYSGEYGHIHHRLTNKIVTDIYNDLELDNKLYFFGKYYTKKKIKYRPASVYKIDKKTLNIKRDKMIKKYKSQKFIQKMFGHMFKYEDWELYIKGDDKNDKKI